MYWSWDGIWIVIHSITLILLALAWVYIPA
jgi:hypothetical protein